MLVVICEATLERPLIADALRLGARGYTIAEVRGSGRGGTRDGAWASDRSIEMKIICEADIAENLAEHVLTTYAENYAVTLYLNDVSILRPEKF
jgi:nitrogen regulatory protein P-II 2